MLPSKAKGIALLIVFSITALVRPVFSSSCCCTTTIKPVVQSCNFYIETEESTEINGCGFLNLKIQNFSHEDARITIRAEGADIDTIFYFVPAQTAVDKKLFVRVTSNNAKIVLNADLGCCGSRTKEIKILGLPQANLTAQKDTPLVDSEPEKIEPGPALVLPNLELYYSIGKQKNTTYVDVSLRNASELNVVGTLFADVPDGYRSSTHSVELAPFEEKSFRVWIYSDSKDENFSFDLVFALAEFSFRERVYVEAKEKSPFAPLIALFSYENLHLLLTVGILFIILLLVLAVLRKKPKHRKKLEWE
ncbi:MAG: hypothetical protein QW400_01640 [Candidatus Diapherotrites archaeon]